MTYRKLRKEEWDRLKPIFEVEEWPLPDSNFAIVIVAEDSEGRIRGCITTELQWMAKDLWIHPESKGTVSFRGLATGIGSEFAAIVDKLPENSACYFLTEIENVGKLAEPLGFEPLDARVWRLGIK